MAKVKSYRKWQFKQQFERLPSHIKKIAENKFKLFLNDPNHPSFRARKIKKTKSWEFPHYEYSVTMEYRATCFRDGNTYIWVFIGTHDEFDRLY